MVGNGDITEVTARLVAKSAEKSLCDDGSSKGIFQALWSGPKCFAGGNHARRGTWCCEGKLVVHKGGQKI